MSADAATDPPTTASPGTDLPDDLILAILLAALPSRKEIKYHLDNPTPRKGRNDIWYEDWNDYYETAECKSCENAVIAAVHWCTLNKAHRRACHDHCDSSRASLRDILETHADRFRGGYVSTNHPLYFEIAKLALRDPYAYDWDEDAMKHIPTDRADYGALARIGVQYANDWRLERDKCDPDDIPMLVTWYALEHVPTDRADYGELARLSIKNAPLSIAFVPTDRDDFNELLSLAMSQPGPSVISECLGIAYLPKDRSEIEYELGRATQFRTSDEDIRIVLKSTEDGDFDAALSLLAMRHPDHFKDPCDRHYKRLVDPGLWCCLHMHRCLPPGVHASMN